MNTRAALKISFATLVMVGSLGSIATADTGWTVIPSQSPVVFSGVMGDAVWNYNDDAPLGGTSGVEDANGNPRWIQEYQIVPQTANDNNPLYTNVDPNWGPYAGFSNSM